MTASQSSVFTIGHSNHAPDTFLKRLRQHGVDEVADVRSDPYSRYTPHFNRESLNRMLDEVGVAYTFLGSELGGRPDDRSCYDANGRVQYDRVAATDQFDNGIRRLIGAAAERRIVLMCTEKEPLECHRTLLVAHSLAERCITVEHILFNGSLENHDVAMNRLLDIFKLPYNGDLFRSRAEIIADALTHQAQKVAYVGEIPLADRDNWEGIF